MVFSFDYRRISSLSRGNYRGQFDTRRKRNLAEGDLASCSSKKNSIYCEILKRQVVEIKGLSHLRLASQMNNHTSDIAGSVVKKSADQKVFDGSTGGFCGHRQQGGGTNLGPKKTLQDLKLGTMRRYKPRQN